MTEQNENTYSLFVQKKAQEWQTPERILAQFAAGPQELDLALAGLSEPHLDVARAVDKWTIRQIVHHIVHGDDHVTMCIKAAIGNPGCTFEHSWYDHQAWVEALNYAGRALTPGLDHLRANRRLVVQLVQHVPDAWEKHVLLTRSNAHKLSVGDAILILASHIPWHIEQIRETRQVHGL